MSTFTALGYTPDRGARVTLDYSALYWNPSNADMWNAALPARGRPAGQLWERVLVTHPHDDHGRGETCLECIGAER